MIAKRFTLTGKVALVTGAARGLGQAMALGLAEAGADVAVADIVPADETVKAVRSQSRQCEAMTVSVEGLNQVHASSIVEECVRLLGRLDILVNNAGIIRRASALEFSENDWHQVIDINLNSCFFLSQAAARHFVAENKGGKIINVASMLSFQGGILVPSYTSAKSGITGMTRALANEWARLGINVNAIAPGYMATEVTRELRADEVRSRAILERIPAGRWGKAEDLQGVTVFLASEASDYVHGSVIPIDGGWLAR